MKKETKKIILSSLITGIICTGIGVSASTYFSANQIKFTPTDVNWKVDNAQDAMNNLYSNQVNTITDLTSKLDNSTKVYSLGTGTSFNIKTMYPDIDYTKLTAQNFIAGVTSGGSTYTGAEMIGGINQQGWARGFSVGKTYDPSTGILTLTGTAQTIVLRHNYSDSSLGASATQNFTTFAYLVTGSIE